MPSPFPGMDPYLEISGDWRDFHATFISAACDVLNERVPAHYVARIDERFRLVAVPRGREPGRLPDVSVMRTGPSPRPSRAAVGTLARERVTLRLTTARVEEVRETFIEVRRVPDWSLVTAIEVLSPTNKAEPGFGDYIAKRVALIGQPVHLVELDLLIAGHRLPMDDPLPHGDYYAFISRADRRPESEVDAWTIREPLPSVPIPLDQPDADVVLDLFDIFATTFRRRHYERSIDYAEPLALPLAPEDRAWAEETARTALA